jgi:hypothetical protein
MITRTYYWDGKLISEFIPPENFFVDPTVELRADIAVLTHNLAVAEAALEPFATHYVDDSEIDDDEADFDGHSLLVKNFRTARTALAAIREQHTPTATQPAPRHKS